MKDSNLEFSFGISIIDQKIYIIRITCLLLIVSISLLIQPAIAQERTGENTILNTIQNNDQARDSQGRPWIIERILFFLRKSRGYITHDQLEKALGIKLTVSPDKWGGYISKFNGYKNGRLSLQLNEYSGRMPIPEWMTAQGEMQKAHSTLNISFVGTCYALNKAKQDLIKMGLHETGEIGLLGIMVAQFNEENGRTKVKIYFTQGFEGADSCVNSMRLDAYRFRD